MSMKRRLTCAGIASLLLASCQDDVTRPGADFAESPSFSARAAVQNDPRVVRVEPVRAFTFAAQDLPTGIDRIETDKNPNADIDSSNDVVSEASVAMTLRHDTDDDGAFECGTDDDCWNLSGTTASDGTVSFRVKRVATGDYQAEVTALTHSSLTWDASLDADNPDTYTLN